MNDERVATLIMIAFLVAIPTITGVTITGKWKQETVDRGLALYCPNTGAWAWAGECTIDTKGKTDAY